MKFRLTQVVSFYAADVSGIDWMVRHGRSLALSVAVNVAPSRLCAGRYSSEVQEMILSSAVADRVRLSGHWFSPPRPLASIPQPWLCSPSTGDICPQLGLQSMRSILPWLVTYCALGPVGDVFGI